MSRAPTFLPLAAAGDAVPPGCRPIEVRVAELRQLFDEIDPSPFQERDLDPKAAEFIVAWSRNLPASAPLGLVVHLDRAAGPPEEAALLRDAISTFFGQRAVAARRQLRDLFRRGRISLAIALLFLAVSIAVSDALAVSFPDSHFTGVLREGLSIIGWVAMWRPTEVFLYDWWPILAEARLSDRLSAMPVRIEYAAATVEDAWRSDWPANRARKTMTHQHTPADERRIREATLDRTIEDSFPASDPPSTDPNPDDDTVLDDDTARPGGDAPAASKAP